MKSFLSIISLCFFATNLIGSGKPGSDVIILFNHKSEVEVSPLQQQMRMAIEAGSVEGVQAIIDQGYNITWSDFENLKRIRSRRMVAHSRVFNFCFRIGDDASCNRSTAVISKKCDDFYAIRNLMQRAWRGNPQTFKFGF